MGYPGTPVYLLDGRRPILFEAGYSCLGRIYEEAIRSALGSRQPEILFITHVHFDHCGATSYLKKVFPELQVAASGLAAQIIQRPSAQQLMRTLSQNVISSVSGVDRTKLINEPFEPFEVDIVLTDGQVMELDDGVSVRALTTPGHTRDFLSYYIPERRILIASEAAGCADMTGQVMAEFLVDYESYLAGELEDYSYPEDKVAAALESVPVLD